MDIEITKQLLSDCSTAFNIVLTQDDNEVIFACTNEEHAKRLAKELEACSWVEIV